MSLALFVAAVLLVLAVGHVAVRRAFPRASTRLGRVVFGEPPAEESASDPDQLRPEEVPQDPAAVTADSFRMTREERDRFELAVAVYQHVSAGRLVDVRPEVER